MKSQTAALANPHISGSSNAYQPATPIAPKNVAVVVSRKATCNMSLPAEVGFRSGESRSHSQCGRDISTRFTSEPTRSGLDLSHQNVVGVAS